MSSWKDTVTQMHKNNRSLAEMSKRTGKTPDEIKTFLKEEKDKPKEKLTVYENLNPKTHKQEWNQNQILTFGLMGDTQINSKYTQLTYLHHYYDICAARGIKDVYHTGDIDEGEQMRMGHQYECYHQGADDHIDEIVRTY
jgi:hypothetical protein